MEDKDLRDKDKEMDVEHTPDAGCESQEGKVQDIEMDVEEQWAERLGLDFDRKKAQTPPPVPPQVPPVYTAPVNNAAYQQAPGYQQTPTPQSSNVPPVPGENKPPMPPTYMVWAILSTICCCLVAGIVAIYFSAVVSGRYYAGNYAGAEKASRNAQIWIIIAIVGGIITNSLYMPFAMLMPG